VLYGEFEYTFKVPSIKDRMDIQGKAALIRKQSDPEGTGFSLGYDPSTVMLSDKIATFMVLLKDTSAPWVYSPDVVGKPVIDIDKWPDNVPILEVVDQFNVELAKFRGTGV